MAPLVVELDGERRSLPAEVVREVLRLADLTPVPSAPPAVCGLSQLRGQIVPVVDPTCLADARWPSTRRRRGPARLGDPLVLVEAGGVRAALLVDRVLDERAEGVATEAARALDPAELFASLRASIAGRPSPLLARSRPSSPWFDPAGGGLSAADVHQLRAFFFDEAAEHLDAIDRAVLALERSPSDPGAATALLRELHTLKGSAGSVALHELARLAHAVEDRVIALGHHPAGGDELRALVASVEHLRVQVAHADRPSSPALPPLAAAGGEPAGMHESSGSDEPAPSIRVEVDRVDALMEAVAELVQDRTRIARQLQEVEECVQVLARAQGTLDELARPGGDPRRLDEAEAWLREVLLRLGSATQRLASGTDGLRHTSRVLQDGLQRMRMMEVGRLFARIAGPARELARRSGREVEVRTTGEATAIDKAIVERIAEPLLHLVRNAVAHGIEPPSRRRGAGKPDAGTVSITATEDPEQLTVVVRDDGAGVDAEAVTARARELGIDGDATDDLLFAAGLSTARQLGELAGHGVGLSAVRSALREAGCDVRLSSSAAAERSAAMEGHVGAAFVISVPWTVDRARRHD